MTVKDTMDYSFQVKNCQIKIYTATRRLKLGAGHLQFDARTRANQETNKATTIYDSHLRDIYPTDFLMWESHVRNCMSYFQQSRNRKRKSLALL